MNFDFNDDEKMKDFIKFFENMFSNAAAASQQNRPLKGCCSCCLRSVNGYFYMHQYKDKSTVRLFLCGDCVHQCPADKPCTIEGCSLSETYDRYVTSKNN